MILTTIWVLRRQLRQRWPMLAVVALTLVIGTALGWSWPATLVVAFVVWLALKKPLEQLRRNRRGTAAWSSLAWRGGIVGTLFLVAISIRFRQANHLDRFAHIGASKRSDVSSRIEDSFAVPLTLVGYGVGAWMLLKLIGPRSYSDFQNHVRGNQLSTQATIEAKTERERRGEPGLRWAGVEYPASVANRHFLAVGVTGSGKTTVFDILAASLFASHARERFRAVVFDAKTEVLPRLHGMPLRAPVALFHPFDQRGVAWDLAADAEDAATLLEFASILIPELNEAQPFFPQSARLLVCGVMQAFAKTCPRRWTLRDVLLGCDNAEVLREVLERTPGTARLVRKFFEPRSTLQNLLSTIASKLVAFEPVAAAWSHAREKLSLRDWLRSERFLVLGFDDARKAALQPINRLLLQRLSALLLSGSGARGKTWFLLDEARELGKVEGLDALLTRGRSHGVTVALGIQDLEGFRLAMDEKRAHEMLGQCGMKAFLRLDSPQTAEWASKVFGEAERDEYTYSMGECTGTSKGKSGEFLGSTTYSSQTTTGKSVTLSNQRVKREVVLPSQFQTLPLGNWTDGIEGFASCAGYGCFPTRLSASRIARHSPPPNRAVPAFLPRPKHELELALWTLADLQRLGLPPRLLKSPPSPASIRRQHRRT